MTIASAICNRFKLEMLLAGHDLSSDVIKMALYTDAAELSADTLVYATEGEVVAAGYTEGGVALELSSGYPRLSGDRAEVRFEDAAWSSSSITARACLIYNASKGNRAIRVYDFGMDRQSLNSTFRVRLPMTQLPPVSVR